MNVQAPFQRRTRAGDAGRAADLLFLRVARLTTAASRCCAHLSYALLEQPTREAEPERVGEAPGFHLAEKRGAMHERLSGHATTSAQASWDDVGKWSCGAEKARTHHVRQCMGG